MVSVIERRHRALARGSSYARFRLRSGRTEINRTTPSRSAVRYGVRWTCAFRVSDDQNGPSSSRWSLVAQHADETAVIRDPCSVLRVARQREPASSSRSAAAVTDAYGGRTETSRRRCPCDVVHSQFIDGVSTLKQQTAERFNLYSGPPRSKYKCLIVRKMDLSRHRLHSSRVGLFTSKLFIPLPCVTDRAHTHTHVISDMDT